jgi:ubiquinone/menaquinone biosynthesis C-methylase UbiE
MNNTLSNLSEHSTAYHQQANVYKLFSQAEDYPALVYQFLKEKLQNLRVLDLGCGNGKYTSLLTPYTQSIIGGDQSFSQLQQFEPLSSHLEYLRVQLDGRNLPFKNSEFDCVLACWMLGTITDMQSRIQVLNEMKRITKKTEHYQDSPARIILIENAPDSEFEILRGRHSSIDTRTADYNGWLEQQGFTATSLLDSFFQFPSNEQAQEVFHQIWQQRLTSNNVQAKIAHQIVIYEWKNLEI